MVPLIVCISLQNYCYWEDMYKCNGEPLQLIFCIDGVMCDFPPFTLLVGTKQSLVVGAKHLLSVAKFGSQQQAILADKIFLLAATMATRCCSNAMEEIAAFFPHIVI